MKLILSSALVAMLAACAGTGSRHLADEPDYASRFAYEAILLARAEGPRAKADALLELMEYRLAEMERLTGTGRDNHVFALARSYRELCVKALAVVAVADARVMARSGRYVARHGERFLALPVEARENHRQCRDTLGG